MTRPFAQLFDCPYCGRRSTNETAFSRWTRDNNLLESSDGIVIIDQDIWVHRFKSELGRLFQCLMLVELKINGAGLTSAQRDTLYIVDQVMRNRKETPTKGLIRQSGTGIVRAYSSMSKRKISLRTYGCHVLRLSHLCPNDSSWIRWDEKEINIQMLIELLRFERDPDTLQSMDFRNHHRDKNTNQRPLLPLGD